MQAQRGGGSIAPIHSQSSGRRRWVFSTMLRPFYPGKTTYPLHWTPCVPRGRSGRHKKCTFTGIQSPDHPACRPLSAYICKICYIHIHIRARAHTHTHTHTHTRARGENIGVCFFSVGNTEWKKCLLTDVLFFRTATKMLLAVPSQLIINSKHP